MGLYDHKNNQEAIEELKNYLEGDVFIRSYRIRENHYEVPSRIVEVTFVVFDNKKSAPFGAPKSEGETTTESEPDGSTRRIGNQGLLVKGSADE